MPYATIRIPKRVSKSPYHKIDAAKRREEKLKADKNVTIISPQMVQCKRCDARIKLSDVYDYEASHWKTHIKRCRKRNPKVMEESRFGEARHSETPASSAEPSFSSCSTPSLTSDDDDGEESRGGDDRPPSPSPSPPLPVPEPLLCPPLVEEYLKAVHGKSAYPVLDTDWRSWSWSNLQEANFPSSSQ